VPLTFDPGVLALLCVAAALYLRALSVIGSRGLHVSRWQQAAWWTGLALWAAALLGPIDSWSDDLLSAHMAQHLLLAELGAPLLLLGLRAPVIHFVLPKPALKTLARRRGLRRFGTLITHPIAAVFIYLVVLYAWHFAYLFEAAGRNDWVHLLQHQSFIAIAILVWLPALEPTRRHMRGELWKAGHIIGARMVGMFLGMALLVMRTPAYDGFYGERARDYGISPIADQQAAGGMMLTLDVVIILVAVGYFFWRSAQDHDRDEALRATAPRVGVTTK
jgi:cytochrome c oxidase assembly factor CtaG